MVGSGLLVCPICSLPLWTWRQSIFNSHFHIPGRLYHNALRWIFYYSEEEEEGKMTEDDILLIIFGILVVFILNVLRHKINFVIERRKKRKVE